MRHGRAKAARKTLQYYQRTIGLKPPYSVLLDGNFITRLHRQTSSSSTGNVTAENENHDNDDVDKAHSKTNNTNAMNTINTSSRTGRSSGSSNPTMRHRMERVLQVTSDSHRCEFYATQATVDEMELIYQSLTNDATNNKDRQAASAMDLQQALQWIHQECRILPPVDDVEDEDDDNGNDDNGETTPKTPARVALMHYLLVESNNNNHNNHHHNNNHQTPYIVATQDDDILNDLRQRGTVPILRLVNNHSVLILENPSKSSQRQALGNERSKWNHGGLAESEQALVDLVKRQERSDAKMTSPTTIHGSHGASSPPPPLPPPPHHRQQQKRVRKSNKAKGPNPLSCKRKRSDDDDEKGAGGGHVGGGGSGAPGKTTGLSASQKRRNRAAKRQQQLQRTAEG